jgi:hypothetical protein
MLPARPDTYGSEDAKFSDGSSLDSRERKTGTKSNLPIPREVEANLRNLIRLYPSGLPVTKLVRIYEVCEFVSFKQSI